MSKSSWFCHKIQPENPIFCYKEWVWDLYHSILTKFYLQYIQCELYWSSNRVKWMLIVVAIGVALFVLSFSTQKSGLVHVEAGWATKNSIVWVGGKTLKFYLQKQQNDDVKASTIASKTSTSCATKTLILSITVFFDHHLSYWNPFASTSSSFYVSYPNNKNSNQSTQCPFLPNNIQHPPIRLQIRKSLQEKNTKRSVSR